MRIGDRVDGRIVGIIGDHRSEPGTFDGDKKDEDAEEVKEFKFEMAFGEIISQDHAEK